MYLKVNGDKIIIAATHEKAPTSKSYMGPTWMLMWKGEVSQSYLSSYLQIYKIERFFQKMPKVVISIKKPQDNSMVT